MAKVVKYYEVYDIGYKTESAAKKALEGWEHKEKVNEIYAVVTGSVPSEINFADNDYPHFRSKAQAEECAAEY